MVDPIIVERIREEYGTVDPESPMYLLAEQVDGKPRVLDKAPSTVKLNKMNMCVAYGCCNEFISAFNSFKSSMNLETAVVDLNGLRRVCDPDVYYALHSLALFSAHVVEERASAATFWFRTIIMAKVDTLTVARIYEVIHEVKSKDYYTNQFMQALQVCLFNENESVLCWRSLIEDTSFYPEAIRLGSEYIKEHDLDQKAMMKLLRETYSVSSKDKEFMKEIYKPACNKWLSSMIYLLKDEHPEVLKMSKDNNGFA